MKEVVSDILAREISYCLPEELTTMIDILDRMLKRVDYADILIGEYLDPVKTVDYDNFLDKVFGGRDRFISMDIREILSISLRMINSDQEFKSIFEKTMVDVRNLTFNLIKIQDPDFKIVLKEEVEPFFKSIYFYRIYGSTILKIIDQLVKVRRGGVNG